MRIFLIAETCTELEALPDAPGLYLFHAQPEPPPAGARDPALFVGRAQSLRARVREHFGAGARKGRDAELAARALDYLQRAQRKDRKSPKVASARHLYVTVAKKYGITTDNA